MPWISNEPRGERRPPLNAGLAGRDTGFSVSFAASFELPLPPPKGLHDGMAGSEGRLTEGIEGIDGIDGIEGIEKKLPIEPKNEALIAVMADGGNL